MVNNKELSRFELFRTPCLRANRPKTLCSIRASCDSHWLAPSHAQTGGLTWSPLLRYSPVFAGKVYVGGKLTKAGGGFKIDHPLEPTRRYLNHAFVESADMKNLYDGIASLDKKGEAVVELPKWFQALNKDIRIVSTRIPPVASKLEPGHIYFQAPRARALNASDGIAHERIQYASFR